MSDAARVNRNISSIYERRRIAVYALCLRYAALALNYFRAQKASGAYWSNQTGQAAKLMFTDAYMADNVIGWFMAHGVEYGVYLELANDGAHEAIRPVVQHFVEPFYRELKELY